jgi:hypothetical protein
LRPDIRTQEIKSITRSIRLTQDLDNTVKTDAQAQGVSVSSLITSILTKYREWDRNVKRSGFITIPGDFLKGLLDLAEGQELARMAAEVGPTWIRENLLVWFKKEDLDEFIVWVSLYCKYSGVSVDVSTDETGRVLMNLGNDLGEKWAKFLAELISQTMESLYGISPEIQTLNDLIVVKFQNPSQTNLRISE